MPPLDDGSEEAAASSLNKGDVFLILDLPPNSTVGCDARAIGTGTSSFQGIRDIPPGPHFIWISETNAMSRCGYWFVTKEGNQGQVRVKQWDKFNEVLVNPASNFELRDHRDNVASLYSQLFPYDLTGGGDGSAQPARPQQQQSPAQSNLGDAEEAAQLWRRLTSCISEELLARVTGRNTTDLGGEWLVDTSDGAAGDPVLPHARANQLYQTLVGATGELRFLFPESDVDVYTVAGAGATAMSAQHNPDHHPDHHPAPPPPDTSADILRLVDTPGTGVADRDLIGELQFTFLTGLHLGNLSCIEQWWHLLLKVILRAHNLVLQRPSLCCSLLDTFHAQLVYNDKYLLSSPSAEFVEDEAPRREYGGPTGGESTSILEIVPGNKRKLREALTLYKRRMNEILLNLLPDRVTDGQGAVGRVFEQLEAWFWRFGWDLRTDYVGDKKGVEEADGELDFGYEDDDEYRPVIVNLDEDGREVGLVSFN